MSDLDKNAKHEDGKLNHLIRSAGILDESDFVRPSDDAIQAYLLSTENKAQRDEIRSALAKSARFCAEMAGLALELEGLINHLTSRIIANSDAMKNVLRLADSVKESTLTVYLQGETGTGKDLVAEYIHLTSHRATRPIRTINCSVIPESLLEAELFGFVAGSFSGAIEGRKGLLESANTGTVCFDEIDTIPYSFQAKLLHVLSSKKVRRIGSLDEINLDVRFIILSSSDLARKVHEGTFRGDLYHCLNQLPIQIPPLRERYDDVLPLVEEFFLLHGMILDWKSEEGSQVLQLLLSHSWPGNIRELRNVVEMGALMSQDKGDAGALSFMIQAMQSASLASSERHRLLDALQCSGDDIAEAAKKLGMSTSDFASKLRKYNY